MQIKTTTTRLEGRAVVGVVGVAGSLLPSFKSMPPTYSESSICWGNFFVSSTTANWKR